MKNQINKIRKHATTIAVFTTTFNLMAQTAGSQFQRGLNIAAGTIILISVIWSVTTAWSGINRIKEGDPTGKNAIWTAILIFIIPLLLFAVFRIFFPNAPRVTPEFDF